MVTYPTVDFFVMLALAFGAGFAAALVCDDAHIRRLRALLKQKQLAEQNDTWPPKSTDTKGTRNA